MPARCGALSGEKAPDLGASGVQSRGSNRSTQRYEKVVPDYELKLVARMNELARRHPRYGYRRIHALLVTEGWRINRKRIERLWRLEGHRVPLYRSKASGQRARRNGRELGLGATGNRTQRCVVLRLHLATNAQRLSAAHPQRGRRVHASSAVLSTLLHRSAPATSSRSWTSSSKFTDVPT